MKYCFFLCGLLLLGSRAMAQNPVEDVKGPVKFSDVIALHEKQQAAIEEHREKEQRKSKKAGKKLSSVEEDADFQFDRWKWYWQQHLDVNGYLVSPVKTWNEWEKTQQHQKALRTTTATATWTFEGPNASDGYGSGVGRITTVAFHPTNANTYWIASPAGGAWKTINNGATWTCLTDQMPLISLSDIKVNQQNPNTIYLCTGDKDANAYFSTGVMKTYDGGAHWFSTGLTFSITSMDLANSLLINPNDTNTVIVGTRNGVYLSHNGGTTFTLSSSTSGLNFKQLLYHPTDTNIVYGTTRYDNATGVSGQIYRSANGGRTWTQITSFSDALRITLAVTPAAPGVVKAVVASSDWSNYRGLEGFYNSTDAGMSYSMIYSGGCWQNFLCNDPAGSSCGGQGEYDLALAISPTNPNLVYVGGVNGWNSADGGYSWEIMNQWSTSMWGVVTVHADKHFMGFHPLVPGRFFECNDGGIYWTDDPTSTGTWNDVTNGLGIGSFYRVAVSNIATYEMGGAQDDGTKLVRPGLFSQDVLGGDGMQCQLDPLDTNTIYASWQNGNIYIFTASSYDNISSYIPGTPTGGWVTPYVIEPACNTCLLAGYQQVYRSTDQGYSWVSISPDLTTSDLLRVATSFSDPNTIYAAEDHSANIFYTHDLGASGWSTLTAPYSGAIISDVKVDQFNPNKIFVTFSGYGSPQVVTYAPGTGWTSFNTGLPDVPVTSIIIDSSNRTKYIGTDIGVFYRDTTMSSWQPYGTGMPVVRVNDVQINYGTGKLWAATYGRSLWKASRVSFVDPLSVAAVAPKGASVVPNPGNGNFTITLTEPVTANTATVRLFNSLGQVVWMERLPVTGSRVIKTDIRNVSKGLYILEIGNTGNATVREKVVIE